MVHKNQQIELTPRRTMTETPGYRSVFFERPPHFSFEAGDWIDIESVGGQLSGGKTYSLSSSPTEDELRITFREGMPARSKAGRARLAADKSQNLTVRTSR